MQDLIIFGDEGSRTYLDSKNEVDFLLLFIKRQVTILTSKYFIS